LRLLTKAFSLNEEESRLQLKGEPHTLTAPRKTARSRGTGQNMAQSGDLSVRFWGVRGSIACPGPETVRYGGNTSCLEVRCGEHLIILDGGTGLRELGVHLLKEGGKVDADLFYSHTHFDHICGLPFFAPCFIPAHKIRMWAGHLLPEMTLETVLCGMMMAPLFPVPMGILGAQVSFQDFAAGETIEPRPGVVLRTAQLNHPNGATGYRIEYGGKVIAYITDTEHTIGRPDENVLRLIDGADIMIYDSTYTDAEYPAHVDWGHSTWEEGARLADAANVKTFVIFHHDPGHDDDFMDGIASTAAEKRPGTLVAKEGMVLQA
jgi:phosphoribosyl 1,2-cyclic phosphodiesterase